MQFSYDRAIVVKLSQRTVVTAKKKRNSFILFVIAPAVIFNQVSSFALFIDVGRLDQIRLDHAPTEGFAGRRNQIPGKVLSSFFSAGLGC